VKGKEISAYITELSVRRQEPGDSRIATCVSIDPQDDPEMPDSLSIQFRK
jgi:hypothetical protein